MVTGQVPFDGKNPSSVMHKHLKAELVPPDHVYPKLSAGLSEVVEMMMAKDPKARYQSCKDLLADLRAVRAKQSPPLAHKDFGQLDLAAVAKAEASAAAAPMPEAVKSAPVVRPWLFWTMIVSLVLNVILVIVLIFASGQ
jgi:serine/threonine-protein kinase